VKAIDHLLVRSDCSIRQVMETIDRGEEAIALIVASDGTLEGTVTDGDIRRALLAGATLEDTVVPYVSPDPITVLRGTDRAAVLDMMRARQVNQVPVVDEAGRLVGLHVVREVLGSEARTNWAVVLAGGRGTRLGPLTRSTPKPMLPVAGRPILERIVLHLVGSGISTIYLAVGYLSEQIRGHFGTGADFGCTIEYLEDDPAIPLGTGGPLRMLSGQTALPSDPLLVLNGDLVTSFSVEGILGIHHASRAAMTVALREYVHDVPFGVAQLDDIDGRSITRIDEKPRWNGLVNAGIYVVDPAVVEIVPAGVVYPITDLVNACLERGHRVAGWRLIGEWHDVGRPLEFARARGEV
jgi:dTDP-glucose pyrophosphorylase